MQVSAFEFLNSSLGNINKQIELGNLDGALQEVNLIQSALTELFNSNYSFSARETHFLADFSKKFQCALNKVNNQKIETMKQIGTQINTQKKIAVYKNIK